jgi:ABC-2 type transport system permease protein
LKTLLGQVALETRLFLRRKDDLFWTVAFPMFFIVLYGLIYGDTTWQNYGIRAIDYTLPGIMVMALMVTGIIATASGFAEDREKGLYRRLALTPLKRQTLMAGQILHRYFVIVVQTLLLLTVGVLAFGIKINGNYLWFWLIITLGAICFLSIGFALTILIRSAKSATPICMTVYFLLMFLGGLFFPVNIMPDFLKAIANILPATNLNDAMRMIIIQGATIGDVWKQLLIVVGWTAGCLVLAIKYFRWE